MAELFSLISETKLRDNDREDGHREDSDRDDGRPARHPRCRYRRTAVNDLRHWTSRPVPGFPLSGAGDICEARQSPQPIFRIEAKFASEKSLKIKGNP